MEYLLFNPADSFLQLTVTCGTAEH
jgi:hypothetical protein